MLLSILIPILDEEASIEPLHAKLAEVLDGGDHDYEVIFVNDGSTDGSAEKLDRLAKKDERVRVIHMRRNYGQTAAIMAAIQNSRGDVLIPMDGDMQNDPIDIPRLLEKMDEGFDVVSGWRKEREDRAISRRLPSVVANRLISWIFGVKLHDYGCTLKAYRREVIDNVRLYGEMHRFIPIYAAWEGARVTEIPVTHHARGHGVSKYGMGRVTRVILDILVLYFIDHSLDRPIQFFGKIGLFSLVLAFLALIWAVAMKVFMGTSFILTPLPLLAGTLGIAGVMFLLLGVVAEIQSRTYYESQGKTTYTIKSKRNFESDASRKNPKTKDG
ncbi:MAG: glycosyltransferase family 2 protein [Rhodospirillales bacterium]